MVKVHRITMIVVDHDGMDDEDMIELIEDSGDIPGTVVVTKHESAEIEWDTDDNPFNYRTTIPAAAKKLFAK